MAARPAIWQKFRGIGQQKTRRYVRRGVAGISGIGDRLLFAAAMSTGYQLAVSRPPSFQMLSRGPSPSAFAAVPFLVFAAPYLIVRSAGARRACGSGRSSAR